MLSSTYKESGVDIDRANTFVEQIKLQAKTTLRPEVVGTIGGFGGLFHLDRERYRNPLLVASTDGVGTKLKVAQLIGKHDTVGIDLVAMSVNDIVVQGAEPLFFLDYLAMGKLDPELGTRIIEGIVHGCQEAGCALLGGETAEMPGMYREGEYDLAGFCVGAVESDQLIDGTAIHVGDRIIGLASCGLHSNGFSLVRKIVFEDRHLTGMERIEGLDEPLGLTLLTPTKIYVRPVLHLLSKHRTVKGLVHITGGGFIDNIPRVLPKSCQAQIERGTWPIPRIFSLLASWGNVPEDEMFRVFNMGIGMMLIVSPVAAAEIVGLMNNMGEQAFVIGKIKAREQGEPAVVMV